MAFGPYLVETLTEYSQQASSGFQANNAHSTSFVDLKHLSGWIDCVCKHMVVYLRLNSPKFYQHIMLEAPSSTFKPSGNRGKVGIK